MQNRQAKKGVYIGQDGDDDDDENCTDIERADMIMLITAILILCLHRLQEREREIDDS